MRKPILIAASMLGLALALGVATFSAEPVASVRTQDGAAGLPAHVPRFNRAKPIVAIIGENAFTELTDYVLPYGVLAESGVARVMALATRDAPIQMFPALRIKPQATVAQFDAKFPEGADYVIVPAVHRTDDSALLAWITAQAGKGAIIVGICDGVWVLANAGLLDGRQAVGHWFSFDDLAKKFTKTQWIRNTRYLADGNVVTTTGVTASIPVSIALVEAIAGRERAITLAQRLGAKNWSAEHQSGLFKLTLSHMLTAAINWLAFWNHEDIGIPINDGVDEVALALVADAYSRTYRSNAYSLSSAGNEVISRRGLAILPDKSQNAAKAGDRSLNLRSDLLPIAQLDVALQTIGQSYGIGTADFVALQIEYPGKWQETVVR